MGDDSSRSIVKSLKKEWALFLEVFHGDEDKQAEVSDGFEKGKAEIMNLDTVRGATRRLTEDRKKLNQQLEVLSRELEDVSNRLENLNLVGGDTEETLNRIHELNDLGLNITEALAKLDQKLRGIRAQDLQFQEQEF